MSLSGGDSRDYVGPVEYLNSSLFAIKHPEGRLAQGTTYEYFLTDHLGNIRAVATNSGITQWTEYDPWGMELAALSSGTSTNRDRFNGKENLAEIGNGMLDYGARLYDATIGRWGIIDPLAEKATHWSPYRFGFDNPVSVTDPTGMFEYSNGYTTQDSKYITGAMEFNGVFQNGGGDGPGKGQATSSLAASVTPPLSSQQNTATSPNDKREYDKASNNQQQNSIQNPRRENWIVTMLRQSALFPGVGMISGASNTANIAVKILEVDENVVIYAAQVGEQKVEVIAHILKEEGKLLMQKTHIQGAGPNSLGNNYRTVLREIFTQIGKLENVQQVIVEPGKRTSGKMIGQVPKPQTINIP